VNFAVVRTSDGEFRRMDVSEYLKRAPQPVTQIASQENAST
jgi:hypothetical protein